MTPRGAWNWTSTTSKPKAEKAIPKPVEAKEPVEA